MAGEANAVADTGGGPGRRARRADNTGDGPRGRTQWRNEVGRRVGGNGFRRAGVGIRRRTDDAYLTVHMLLLLRQHVSTI